MNRPKYKQIAMANGKLAKECEHRLWEFGHTDEEVLGALANNMRLAPSNDIIDTKSWLIEHYHTVGLERAIDWYLHHDSDWKQGIVQDRKLSEAPHA